MIRVTPRDQLTDKPQQSRHYVHDATDRAADTVTPLLPEYLRKPDADDEARLAFAAQFIRAAFCMQCHDRGFVMAEQQPWNAEFTNEPERLLCSCQFGQDLKEREYELNRLFQYDQAAADLEADEGE